MGQPKRNVDGGLIEDTEDYKPGWLLFLVMLVIFPIVLLGKLFNRIRQGRYWRLSERDYGILSRTIQRRKSREKMDIYR